MIDFIPINLDDHRSILIELNDEYLTWIGNEIKKNYNIDLVSHLGMSIRNYAENSIDELTSYKRPKGIFYILKFKDKIIGMGAFRKLNDNTGEVKRMYIREEFRGKGFGKRLLKKLLTNGEEFGCSRVLLDTGKFMSAAQNVYRGAGFNETAKYPETEVPPKMQPYWIYMEKKL
jgi:GNAT superfamily N-acetyltransferase